MKPATKGYLAIIATLVPTANALAVTGTPEETTGLLVWAFLGFLALIVAVQVIPAAFMALSALKGVVEGVRERRRVTADSEA